MTSPHAAACRRDERQAAVIVLRDEAGPQVFKMVSNDVVRLRITIESAYGITPKRYVAIGEIDAFTRG